MTIPQARGSASQVALDFETTYGVDPVSPVGKSMPFNYPWDLQAVRDLKAADNTHRGRRDGSMPFYGNQDVKGSASIPLDVLAIGWWLRALMGAPSTTGTTPTYTHVFKPGASIPSMVIEAGFTDIPEYIKFNGVKINKFGMDISGDGELVAKLDLVGATGVMSATPYDSGLDSIALTRFQVKDLAILEGGASIAYVKSVNFEINNDLDTGSFVLANSVRGALPEGDCLVSGSMTAFFKDATLYNKAVAGTESSLKLTFTAGAASLEILFQELLYSPKSPTIVKGGIYVEMPFQAYYENGAAAAIVQATLINSNSSYA